MFLKRVPIGPEHGFAILSELGAISMGTYFCPSHEHPTISAKVEFPGMEIGLAMRKKGMLLNPSKDESLAGDGLLIGSVEFGRPGANQRMALTVCLLTDAVSINPKNTDQRTLKKINSLRGPSGNSIRADEIFQLAMGRGYSGTPSAAYLANELLALHSRNPHETLEQIFLRLPPETVHKSFQQVLMAGLNSTAAKKVFFGDLPNRLVDEFKVPIMAVFAGVISLSIGGNIFFRVFSSQGDTYAFVNGVSLGYDRHHPIKMAVGDDLGLKLGRNTEQVGAYSSIGLLPKGYSTRPDAMVINSYEIVQGQTPPQILLITDGALHGNIVSGNSERAVLTDPVSMAESIARQGYCRDDASIVAISPHASFHT